MNLNVNDWKEFKTSKLFYDMQNGKANQQMLENGNECFYVGAKKDDNGVMLHCVKDESLMTKGNCIIFICNGQGSVGYANYMDVDFIGTTDIVAGYNDNLNEYTGIFLATIYSQERPKYSFGRKWKTHLADTKINLPIQHNADGTPFIDVDKKYSDDGYVPDWKFMEDYIKSLNHKPLTTQNNYETVELKVVKWKEFRLGNLIQKPYKAKAFNKDELEETTEQDFGIHYITRTSENNGCELIVNKKDIPSEFVEEGNAISIGDTTATCFYQADEFITGDHMVVVRAEWLNKLLGMFIVSILQKEQYKYSYGRAFLMERISDTVLAGHRTNDALSGAVRRPQHLRQTRIRRHVDRLPLHRGLIRGGSVSRPQFRTKKTAESVQDSAGFIFLTVVRIPRRSGNRNYSTGRSCISTPSRCWSHSYNKERSETRSQMPRTGERSDRFPATYRIPTSFHRLPICRSWKKCARNWRRVSGLRKVPARSSARNDNVRWRRTATGRPNAAGR